MKDDTRKFYQSVIERTLRNVTARLDEAVDLNALARAAALSPLHFHRIFRGMLGETVVELHRRLRLERAAFRLATTEEPVTRLAFEAGYETHESFTRAFRDAYAATPSEFRARARAGGAACAPEPRIELASRAGIHWSDPMSIDISVAFAFGEETIAMQVEIETQAERRVFVVPHRGPYNTISAAFARLSALAGEAGLFETPVQALIGIYHDDPETTPPAELRSEAAIVVPEQVPLPAGLSEARLPAGRYARTTYVGPYQNLGDVWARFMGEWLPRSGHKLGSGPSYEHYWNTPADAKPEELRTDLYISLAE